VMSPHLPTLHGWPLVGHLPRLHGVPLLHGAPRLPRLGGLVSSTADWLLRNVRA